MIILALINAYLPGYKAGGPIQSLANLAEQLGDGFQLKIITSDRDSGDSRPYPTVTPGKWRQVGKAQVLYIPPGDSAPWNLRRIINATPYDVLYLNSFFNPVFTVVPMMLWQSRLIRRTPAVIAPRGELSAGALSLKSVRKRLFLSAARFLCGYNRMIWQASSSHELAEIQYWFPTPPNGSTNIFVAPDLPGRESVETAESVREVRGPKQPGQLRVLFASRISPKKNLLEAFRCLESLNGQVEFNILGPIDDEAYWIKCQNAARSLPSAVTVRYVGPVPHKRVLFEMGQHDLFLLPTLGENFGHAILESLSAGCPVLIGDQTPWRDLDSKRAGWELPVTDREAFRAILQRCIEMDEPEHCQWRAGARALAASVVLDDAAVSSNRNLFVQAMHQGPWEPARRSEPALGETPAFPIAESKSHFDAVAPSWEKKYARGGALQRRAAAFLRCLQKFAPACGHILDFGCGSGDIAITCNEAGYEVTGIDLSSAMIARARLRSYGRGIAFDLLESDEPFKLPYPDAYFDGVLASSVLEYVRSPFECLRELRRVCKPGAVLLASVPNARHPQRSVEVVLRYSVIHRCIAGVDRFRRYGEYLEISRNRFPLEDWATLLRLGGWQMEAVQARARALVMLVARPSMAAQAEFNEQVPRKFEHVFESES